MGYPDDAGLGIECEIPEAAAPASAEIKTMVSTLITADGKGIAAKKAALIALLNGDSVKRLGAINCIDEIIKAKR